MEKLSQKEINERVLKGEPLDPFTDDDLKNVPQEFFNKRVENGAELYGIPEANLENVPQEIINQRAAKGYDLFWISPDKIKQIPQSDINTYVANNGNLEDLDLLLNLNEVPQEYINLRIANGGSFDNIPQEKADAVPQELIRPSKDSIDAVENFRNGIIKREGIPSEAYANFKLRKQIVSIMKGKAKEQFNQICDENGFTKEIPNEIKEAFDKRIQDAENDIKSKVIDFCSEKAYGNKKNDALNKISELEI